MFTKETIGGVIENCRLRAESFRERNGDRCFGVPSIRVSTVGVDGGGLSTYGKSAIIGEGDVYECQDEYLYIRRKFNGREAGMKTIHESIAFIPYESIVAIECKFSAYV